MMDPEAEQTTAALPEMITTVLPSNGQLLVEETEDLVNATLAAMRADIANSPAWNGAPTPSDDFLLMFLRAEVFSPTLAANRYRKFWKVKVELFGEKEAALPIKAEDVSEALGKQFIQIIPGSRDIEGRQVVVVNPGNTDKTIDRKLRVRAFWYVLMVALEDLETQRRGICIVGILKTVKISQMDKKFSKMTFGCIQGAIPVRVGSMNMCYPPSFFRLVWAIISVFLHERLKQRIRVIAGTDLDVLEGLRHVVAAEHLPVPIGTKVLDFAGWVAERIRAEA